MSEISTISDYEARLIALLLGQFRTGTNWLKLWAALADTGNALQLSEDAIYALWQQRSSLSSATGRQLDQWGAVVGLARQGWTDDAYRARILVWLQVLRSRGTPDELITITEDLTGGTVTYWETPPASYSVQFTGAVYFTDPDLALDAARYLALADPAGVGVGQVVSLAPIPLIFGTIGAFGFSSAVTTRGRFSVDAAAEAGV